jgi:uncharacterized membrane protein YdcZ (DUF606 family)
MTNSLAPLLWALALAAGALIPVQAAANAALAKSLNGSVPAAALVLFAVAAATALGALAIGIYTSCPVHRLGRMDSRFRRWTAGFRVVIERL